MFGKYRRLVADEPVDIRATHEPQPLLRLENIKPGFHAGSQGHFPGDEPWLGWLGGVGLQPASLPGWSHGQPHRLPFHCHSQWSGRILGLTGWDPSVYIRDMLIFFHLQFILSSWLKQGHTGPTAKFCPHGWRAKVKGFRPRQVPDFEEDFGFHVGPFSVGYRYPFGTPSFLGRTAFLQGYVFQSEYDLIWWFSPIKRRPTLKPSPSKLDTCRG